MARTRSTTSTPARTQLAWPRQRLVDQIEAQLAERDEMTAALTDPAVLAEMDDLWPVTPTSWHQRNRAILQQAFTTPEALDQYEARPRVGSISISNYQHEPSPTERLAAIREAMGGRARRLRDILGQLDVYPEVPEVASQADDNVDELASTDGPVFVVHGHDNTTKVDVARTLHQLTGRDPVILHEKTNSGRTIIEKFEHYASTAAAAVVILSPDDIGGVAGTAPDKLQARARQNVIFELGWFYAKLQRGRVVALLVGGLERPSDIDGVLYLPVDEAGAWRHRLGKELDAAGLDVDLSAVP